VAPMGMMIMSTVGRAPLGALELQSHAAERAAPWLVSARLGVHGADVCRADVDRGSIRGREPARLVGRMFVVHGGISSDGSMLRAAVAKPVLT